MDFHVGCAFDDMLIGDDVAGGIDEETAAEALLLVATGVSSAEPSTPAEELIEQLIVRVLVWSA